MYKYEIWNESGLLYDSSKNEGLYYDFHEAQSEAISYIQLEVAEAETDITEDDYWYEIVELDPDVYRE